MSLNYPLYRALEGTETLYRVDGLRHFVEWQPVGKDRWLRHQHVAHIYPTQVFIQSLIQGEGGYQELTLEQWDVRRQKRTEINEDKSVGVFASSNPQVEIKEGEDLEGWTTFGVSVKAAFWMTARSDEDIRFALSWCQTNHQNLLVMGGGSNMLLHQPWEGLALHIGIRGFQVLAEEENRVDVVVGAGENWHEWVMIAIEKGWNGLENLALIPGQVGASPMQNIGAYGVELKDCFLWLEAIHVQTGAVKRFDGEACSFGYRESVFKSAEKGQWVITRVAFSLRKDAPLQTSYGAIREELQKWPEAEWTHRKVAQAVIKIRSEKLPDPQKIGNAGSFFKNPVLNPGEFRKLQSAHPRVAHYSQPNGTFKVAAGWLIEQAGWKGRNRSTHGVHVNQALVLVNYGGATGAEIWQLALDIMADVYSKYGIQLEPEVNQIGRD